MEARTGWTFAHMFQDENYWDDSLKADDLVQQFVKKEEKEEEEGATTADTIELSNEVLNEASSFSSHTSPSYEESPPVNETASETDVEESENETGNSSDWSNGHPTSPGHEELDINFAQQKTTSKHVCHICHRTFNHLSTLSHIHISEPTRLLSIS